MSRQSYPLAMLMAVAMLAPAVNAQTPSTVVVNPAPAPVVAAAPPASAGSAAEVAPQVVKITGARQTPTGESVPVFTAKKRMMRGSLSEQCLLDTPYSSSEDDMENYLDQLSQGPGEGEPSDSPMSGAMPRKFSANSPYGDVSTVIDGSSLTGSASSHDVGPCGESDRKFASGRGTILRKDKTFAEGIDAVAAKDYARAIEQFKIAYSKIGYPEAAVWLGKLYLNGQGAPRDVELGKEWLLKAINKRFDPYKDRMRFDPKDPDGYDGRIEATLLMAKMAIHGIGGVRKDAAEARKWYVRASEFGYIPALNTLGLAAQSGFGGVKDINKARAYFQEAAEAGYLPAQFNLGKLYYLGAQGTPQDFKLAGAWFASAAKEGHPGALFAAGRMYDLGEGVPVNQQRAITYYKEAALKSDASAQSALATYFYSGEQVPRNLETARKLFSAAALQGNTDAMFNLAVMSARGEGGDKDLGMAFVWFSLAKASGHPNAATALSAVGPTLSAQDQSKADAILKPRAKS